MSTYTDASLIVTPNAKKAGKLYALKGADLDVVRATTATYVGSDGLIKTALANEVRFDYTNGSCPSILVEPQRTNLLLRSEEFDNLSWTKTSGVVVTSNSEISPNGTLTADTINFGASNRIVAQATTLATGVVATGSIYVKGISGQTIKLAVGGVDVLFTLNGNWQKLEATRTSVTSVFNLNTFSGATARIISVWGAQLEAGSNATSYIPTVASTVTRNADVISKTGISDLIGQSQGVIFTDFNITNNDLSGNKTIINLDDNSYYVNIINARIFDTNILNIQFRAGSVSIAFSNMPIISNGNHKIAIRYGNGFVSIFVDGMLINTQVWTSSFTNTISQLSVGKNRLETPYFNDAINSLALWKTALTNEQCIALTTL